MVMVECNKIHEHDKNLHCNMTNISTSSICKYCSFKSKLTNQSMSCFIEHTTHILPIIPSVLGNKQEKLLKGEYDSFINNIHKIKGHIRLIILMQI